MRFREARIFSQHFDIDRLRLLPALLLCQDLAHDEAAFRVSEAHLEGLAELRGSLGILFGIDQAAGLAEVFEQFLVGLIVRRRIRLLGGIQSAKDDRICSSLLELRPKRVVGAKAQSSGVDFDDHVLGKRTARHESEQRAFLKRCWRGLRGNTPRKSPYQNRKR